MHVLLPLVVAFLSRTGAFSAKFFRKNRPILCPRQSLLYLHWDLLLSPQKIQKHWSAGLGGMFVVVLSCIVLLICVCSAGLDLNWLDASALFFACRAELRVGAWNFSHSSHVKSAGGSKIYKRLQRNPKLL